jgi:hypothetical protein
VFLVLAHDRRRILHFGVTAHPTAEWTAQQLREAFPWDSAPRYLQRDRDQIFGKDFVDQVKALGIKQVLSACESQFPVHMAPIFRCHRCSLRSLFGLYGFAGHLAFSPRTTPAESFSCSE